MSQHNLDWDLIGRFRIAIFWMAKSPLQFRSPNPLHTQQLCFLLRQNRFDRRHIIYVDSMAEKWNRRMVAIIDRRLAEFPAIPPSDFDRRLPRDLDYDDSFLPASWLDQIPSIEELSISTRTRSRKRCTTAHRATHIPEIVDIVMQYADSETRLAAWQVSTLWRGSAEPYLFPRSQPQFWRLWPFNPIQYGEGMSTAQAKLCAPSLEEISILSNMFFHDRGIDYITPSPNYVPSRFVQRRNYPADILSRIPLPTTSPHERLHLESLFLEHQSLSTMRYLDLNRLTLNPFLVAALGPRLTSHYGRLDITLRPGTPETAMIIDPSLITPDLWHSLAPQHITYPPTSCLGIYAVETTDSPRDPHAPYREKDLQLLARIRNPAGLRVKDLLVELNRQAPRALEMWRHAAGQMRDEIAASRWDDGAWCARGTPTLTLLLDSMDMSDRGQGLGLGLPFRIGTHRTFGRYRMRTSRGEYVRAGNVRGARMSEWVGEEMMREFVEGVRWYVEDWGGMEEALRRVDWELAGGWTGRGSYWVALDRV